MIHCIKKQRGQFFTTNSDYILQGLEKYVAGKNVTDPFAGSGDLLQWAKRHNASSVRGYDIDERFCDQQTIFQSDSLLTERTLHVDHPTLQLLRSNILLLKAIDSGSENGKAALENIKKYNIECLVSKPTSRHQVYLVFKKHIPVEEQIHLINLFNKTIEDLRKKHLSLFMTNYRDNDRKRISFEFAYKLLNYLYFTEIKGRKHAEEPQLF